ncbi:MAG: sulfatase-like hydrolase/transferase, partial [Verrucomicrobiales bacterium]
MNESLHHQRQVGRGVPTEPALPVFIRYGSPGTARPTLFFMLAMFFVGMSGWVRATPPNLIVIMVDDMGYAGPSCYGNPYFETPEIDRLAAEGMRFTDFHSSGNVCSPTRAGLLTGRYQQRAGIEAVIHPVADHPEHR